jgi:hypothetical protein
MKKFIVFLLSAVVMLVAVDLDGKIGMGLGFSPDTYLEGSALGLPVIDIAVTKIGLKPHLAVEPIAQFTLSGNGGTDIYFALSALGNWIIRGHRKTNLYAKLGLGFMLDTSDPETMFGFNLPFGFGLEHFVSEHFSLNLSALSGFTYISNPQNTSGSHYELKLGNQKPFAFYLLWYY